MEMKHIVNPNSRSLKHEHDSKQNEKKMKKCYIEIGCLMTYFYKQIWFECLLVSSCFFVFLLCPILFKTITLNSFVHFYSDQSVYMTCLFLNLCLKCPSGSSVLSPSLHPPLYRCCKFLISRRFVIQSLQRKPIVLFVVSSSSAKRQLDVWVGDTIWRAGDRMESSRQWQIWKSLQASLWCSELK